MFQKLLVAVDGSESARTATRLAPLLAAPGASLTLVHAVRPSPIVAGSALDASISAVTGAGAAVATQIELTEERQASAWLQEGRALLPPDADVATRAIPGRASDVVLELLEKEGFDAVLVGSRGRGLIARTLLGSVSSALLQHADRVPVGIARRDRVTRILVGVDDSRASLRAAKVAGELARRHGATLTLLHALEFPVETFSEGRDRIEQSLRAHAAGLLARARTEAGAAATEETAFVEPAHALLSATERLGADLVVLGRRGERPSRWTRLGSVSHKVAMNASASVLVVP